MDLECHWGCNSCWNCSAGAIQLFFWQFTEQLMVISSQNHASVWVAPHAFPARTAGHAEALFRGRITLNLRATSLRPRWTIPSKSPDPFDAFFYLRLDSAITRIRVRYTGARIVPTHNIATIAPASSIDQYRYMRGVSTSQLPTV